MAKTITCDNCGASSDRSFGDGPVFLGGFNMEIMGDCNPDLITDFDICVECTAMILRSMPKLKEKYECCKL